MEKSTLAQDAKEVLGDETLTEELEKARRGVKSEAVPDVIIKAEDAPKVTAETPAADAGVAKGQPVAEVAPTACACEATVCAKVETPAPEVKSDASPELAARLDVLAAAFGQLATTLQPFMIETAATVKSLSERVEALSASETTKVKSAIDNGGDWLAKFYNPRKATDNKVSADEVAKAEPQSPTELTGIWGMITQKPGG